MSNHDYYNHDLIKAKEQFKCLLVEQANLIF